MEKNSLVTAMAPSKTDVGNPWFTTYQPAYSSSQISW
jgi:hypothetical protein